MTYGDLFVSLARDYTHAAAVSRFESHLPKLGRGAADTEALANSGPLGIEPAFTATQAAALEAAKDDDPPPPQCVRWTLLTREANP